MEPYETNFHWVPANVSGFFALTQAVMFNPAKMKSANVSKIVFVMFPLW
jgi:hypothetical protein